MKTQEQVTQLKRDWEGDPNWDLEETEGFEEHREELLAYRLAKEAEWEAAHQKRLLDKAEKLGCPGNVTLAAYIENLEWRIFSSHAMGIQHQLDGLERRLDRLAGKVDDMERPGRYHD